MGNSIKKPLIGAMCGAIFVAFIVFLVVVRQVILDDYRQDIEINDNKLAEVLSRNINYYLERCFDLGGMAANYPNYLHTNRELQQNILKHTFEKVTSYEFLTIVDKSGKPFIYTNENFSGLYNNTFLFSIIFKLLQILLIRQFSARSIFDFFMEKREPVKFFL